MNQISAPRSLYLCYATALLIFGFLTVPASSAPIDANQTLDSSCLNSPSAPFVDLNIQVTDRTGALVGRAEFEVRCGATVVTGVTGSDGAATIRLRSGNYTLRSNAPASHKNPQPPTSPQRFSLSKDGRGLRAIGFWTLFIVFWWALSGIYFAWYRQVTSAVAVVSPLQGMLSPVVPTQPKPGPDRASLERVLNAIHQASPTGQLFSLSDPLLSRTIIYALVDLRAPGDFSHRDIITLSTADARILTIWHYGQNRTAGDWILWTMHPLHFGTLWGIFFKLIWAFCGLALAILPITGLLMYWNRFLRHQL